MKDAKDTFTFDLDQHTIALNATVSNVKKALSGVAKGAKGGIEQNMSRLSALEASSLSEAHAYTAPPDLSLVFERLTLLEQESARSRASEGAAVGFHDLGFRSKTEAHAWLVLNAPVDQFGFMVDFHTVMEHIQQQITGIDSLSSLGKVYKLKLRTLSEAVSMTSFEIISPRFLSDSGTHNVISAEASYFTRIPSFAQWNHPLEGYKKRWKTELINFRQSHTETLQTHLAPGSPMYILAAASMTESIAWASGFINYIDETYSQYNGGRFGVDKSWHVTTKLATALINDIGEPRRGAMNSFQAGNATQINTTIFYAVLRSLDKMALILSQNYKDAPAVSTELVKFLSMNTSAQAVDTLVEQCKDFKAQITELNKSLTQVRKEAGTVGNKNDKLTGEMTALTKRLVKLEQAKK